ncbi:hypothetical protein B0H19DRAFT_1248728 [Mycena capillaripes]|nr:hypothetical protein B0H19DRAFT_1248728 [Mycena capillaripes]
MPALTAVNIDELSDEYGLDITQRKAAHSFCKRRPYCDAIPAPPLHQTTKQRSPKKIAGLGSHLEAIGVFCTENWKPSKEQVKLFKLLLRHFIIRPITSYSNLVLIVETYINDHAKCLRLELYKQDPTVKAVIHDLLVAENNAVRSALRKLIFTSIEEKTSLKTFSKKTINAYHLPAIPATPPQDIMACFALMRDIARPLVGKKASRSGDTGFWAKLEAALDKLFKKNGNDHSNSKWAEWEREVIEQDNNRYDRHSVETNARTQEEIDAAVLPAGQSNGAAAAVDENDEGTNVEDRAVNVDGLGDLASLDTGPVTR